MSDQKFLDEIKLLKEKVAELELENQDIKQLLEDTEQQASDAFTLLSAIRDLSSPVDEHDVYETILDIMIASIGSFRHSLAIINKNHEVQIVMSKVGDDKLEITPDVSGWQAVRTAIQKQIIITEKDVDATDDIVAAIPLIFQHQIVGVIIIHELLSHKKELSNLDLEIFEVLKTQAALSIALSRTLKGSQDAEKIAKALALEVLRSEAKVILTLDELLEKIMSTIQEELTCGSMIFHMYNERLKSLVSRASRGINEDTYDGRCIKKVHERLSELCFKTCMPITIKDLPDDVRYEKDLSDLKGALPPLSMLAVPIRFGKNILGTVTLSGKDEDHLLDYQDRSLLTNILNAMEYFIYHAVQYDLLEDSWFNTTQMFTTSNELHAEPDIEIVLSKIEEVLLNMVGIQSYAIFQWNKQDTSFTVMHEVGCSSNIKKDLKIDVIKKISKVIETNEPTFGEPISISNEQIHTLAIYPLLVENYLSSALTIFSVLPQVSVVSLTDDVMHTVVEHSATALTSALLHKDLQDANTQAQYMLAIASEYKDRETGDHIFRIVQYTTHICMELGFTKEEADVFGRASMMHDLGKLGIPDAIIQKKGKLTEEEMTTIKTHTRLGAEILGKSRWFNTARQIALYHHERWDGNGYPNGIKGEDIPLPARIVSVADVFDALTSKRPYKDPWPIEKAMKEIENSSGSQFDPQVVDALINLYNEGILNNIMNRFPQE